MITVSTLTKLKENYCEPQYTFLWLFSNRVLIRENKENGLFLFFIRDNNDYCRLLAQNINFEAGNIEAEKFWNGLNANHK